MFQRLIAALALSFVLALPALAGPFSNAQLLTLKAAIAAETDAEFVGYRTAGSTGLMADWFNQATAPTHSVWRTEAPVANLLDAINWALYTPTDAIDSTVTYTNRLLAIQTKQMNLQSMLQGRDRIDCSKATLRLGLRDAVTAVPAGTGGANVNPGGGNGATVLAACTRTATRGEKVFATTSATTGATSAFIVTYEGRVTDADVVLALNAN